MNEGSYAALLRVPGLGVRNVKRILKVRKYRRLNLEDLGRMKASVNRAKYFIVTADHNPSAHQIDSPKLPDKLVQPAQLSLFEAAETARSGEL